MSQERAESLVVCSTLNQITNYLIIKKYMPKKIYNITFSAKACQAMNKNIKISDWDNQLKQEVKDNPNLEFYKCIELEANDVYSMQDVKEKIMGKIDIKSQKPIYWHITGGQRVIALAVNDLIKEKKRVQDRLIYLEGNTERLIINDWYGRLTNKEDNRNECSYGDKSLSFQIVLKLAGFKTKNLTSTEVMKVNGHPKIDESNEKYLFYDELYKILDNERKKPRKYEIQYENKKYKDFLRNLLLKSNSPIIKNRLEYLELIFKDVLEQKANLKNTGYKICESKEMERPYPIGYIFENLAAYQIYKVVQNDDSIIGMETSLKTYFAKEDTKDNVIDELDIVLLTDTGKIINFECKSGGMKGDNAKSHNYTTYRLSGVFGTPIIISPLYKREISSVDHPNQQKGLEKQREVVRAAKNAEIEIWGFEEIKSKLKPLLDFNKRKGSE